MGKTETRYYRYPITDHHGLVEILYEYIEGWNTRAIFVYSQDRIWGFSISYPHPDLSLGDTLDDQYYVLGETLPDPDGISEISSVEFENVWKICQQRNSVNIGYN